MKINSKNNKNNTNLYIIKAISKFLIVALLITSLHAFIAYPPLLSAVVKAEDISEEPQIYVIYTESGDYLFERNAVAVGDEYIDKEMNVYQIIFIDEETKTGTAKYIKTYNLPQLKAKSTPNHTLTTSPSTSNSEQLSESISESGCTSGSACGSCCNDCYNASTSGNASGSGSAGGGESHAISGAVTSESELLSGNEHASSSEQMSERSSGSGRDCLQSENGASVGANASTSGGECGGECDYASDCGCCGECGSGCKNASNDTNGTTSGTANSIATQSKNNIAKQGKRALNEEQTIIESIKQNATQSTMRAKANVRGQIGLYMSHNDESYISGDGYDSVYGKGGIHDITKQLASELSNKNISVIVDETLHLPHDKYAYSRSNVTATNLLNKNKLDAIFDIHRDGTSRGYYITKDQNGKERCMVRMVIGKANPNYEANKGFALYLMSVAKIYCPWLFVDIYMATGHYNQSLKENMVLFEMGCHLVEKDLVKQTVPELANVISTALFGEFEVDNTTSSSGNSISGTSQSGSTSSGNNPNNNQTSGNSNNSGNNGNINTSGGNSGNSNTTSENTTPNSGSTTTNPDQSENNTDNSNNANNNENGENALLGKNETNAEQSSILASENKTNIISGESNLFIIAIVLTLLTAFAILSARAKRKARQTTKRTRKK